MSHPKYPDIHVQLAGREGNVFAIIGAVSAALRRAQIPLPERKEFTGAAMACPNYAAVLALVADTVEVS